MGDNDIPSRLAVLEEKAKNIESELKDIYEDIEEIYKEQGTLRNKLQSQIGSIRNKITSKKDIEELKKRIDEHINAEQIEKIKKQGVAEFFDKIGKFLESTPGKITAVVSFLALVFGVLQKLFA